MGVEVMRECSRPACRSEATATLTYVYADRMAVLGPLALTAEPHAFDLCERHAARTAPPQGWLLARVGGQSEAVRSELTA